MSSGDWKMALEPATVGSGMPTKMHTFSFTHSLTHMLYHCFVLQTLEEITGLKQSALLMGKLREGSNYSIASSGSALKKCSHLVVKGEKKKLHLEEPSKGVYGIRPYSWWAV